MMNAHPPPPQTALTDTEAQQTLLREAWRRTHAALMQAAWAWSDYAEVCKSRNISIFAEAMKAAATVIKDRMRV